MDEKTCEQTRSSASAGPPDNVVSSIAGQRWVIGLLVAAHMTLVLAGTICDSATYCEPANLACGIAYLQYGRADLSSVNPPLSKAIAAFPVWMLLPVEVGSIRFPLVPGDRVEHDVGATFIKDNSDRYWWLLILGRFPGLGWSLLGAWLVYRWSEELFGLGTGVVPLAIWCFEPTIITFAHLITADLYAAVMTLAVGYAFWHYLKAPGWLQSLPVGILLGLALLTKFTLVLLVPTIVVLGVVASIRRWMCHWWAWCGQLLAINFVALFVVNCGYGFEGTGKAIGEFPFVSTAFTGQTVEDVGDAAGNRFQSAWWGHLPSPFPEHFLRGIDLQKRDFERYAKGIPVYLMGEWKVGGWYYYYFYAMLVKLPIGMWLVVILGTMWWLANYRQFRWIDYGCVLVTCFTLFTLVSYQKALNKHFRYMLPALPGLILTGGAASRWAGKQRWRRVSVVVLLGLQAASVTSQAPHSLGYFNELAGGPLNGWRHLSASNIDWGQDLWWLKHWLDHHPGSHPLYLRAYGHNGRNDLEILGLGDVARPPMDPRHHVIPQDPGEQLKFGPKPGRYAVSVLYLQSASYVAPADQSHPARPRPLSYSYLWHFEPIAIAGTSMWVYDISLNEANRVRALYGLAPLTEEDPMPKWNSSHTR